MHELDSAPGRRERRRELVADCAIVVAKKAGLARDVHEYQNDVADCVHCLETDVRVRS